MNQASIPPSPGELQDDQIIALLRSGAHATLLGAYFGEPLYQELVQLARLAEQRPQRQGPLVFILPGIMGSRLGTVNRRQHAMLWLHPAAIAQGGLLQLALPGPKSMRAIGVMLPGYLKLRLSLQVAGFRPVFHPFDWRRDLQSLARVLLRAIERTGSEGAFVVGHSMGGLIARIALGADHNRSIRGLVQLGAPNDGSFAPVQALRATYPTVRKIAALDPHHSAEDLARNVFLTLPGLYQMLPGVQEAGQLDLFDIDNWPADRLRPDEGLLARARRVRKRLPAADERCAVICGTGQDTVTSVTRGVDGFHYTLCRDGDGTVPLSRAVWDGARHWFVEETHGTLTDNAAVLDAVATLLKGGEPALDSQRPAPQTDVVRTSTDAQLRAQAPHKVHWEALSLDSRRRILDPVMSPEFL